MTSTLETPQAEALPDQPPLPAEAATDVPPAASLADLATTQEPVQEPADDTAQPAAPTSEIDSLAASERQKLRERIGKSSSLSRGMRDRLAALVDGEAAAGADSQPLVRAESVLALLEEAIPPQLRLDAASLAQPEHPAGDVFFTGDPNQMTDDQAERIAREQLAQSAFRRQ